MRGLGLAIGLAAVGCTDRPTIGDGGSADGATTAEPPLPTTTTVAPPGTTAATSISTSAADTTGTTGSNTDDGPDSSAFLCSLDDDDHWHCQPDWGVMDFECDLWAQDCPPGEKCMPWANDGGGIWNATRCSPIANDPGTAGEPCTVEGSGTSGIDTCMLGAMCWGVDPATNEGTCVAMCTGNEVGPLCGPPGTSCAITNDGALIVCLPDCNPLAPSCGVGEDCLPDASEMQWVCAPVMAEPSPLGAPCEYANLCGDGSVCVAAEVAPSCAALGCCASVCDLTAPVCPQAGTACVPWFEEAPPGLENVGICVASPVPPDLGWTAPSTRALVGVPS